MELMIVILLMAIAIGPMISSFSQAFTALDG